MQWCSIKNLIGAAPNIMLDRWCTLCATTCAHPIHQFHHSNDFLWAMLGCDAGQQNSQWSPTFHSVPLICVPTRSSVVPKHQNVPQLSVDYHRCTHPISAKCNPGNGLRSVRLFVLITCIIDVLNTFAFLIHNKCGRECKNAHCTRTMRTCTFKSHVIVTHRTH